MGWELDGNKQDVDLNNGVQLEFNLNAGFVKGVTNLKL